jgi:hypothetical protein
MRLFEIVRPQLLYHGTDIGNLVSILEEDFMRASEPRNPAWGGRGPEWEPAGPRFTRNAPTAMYFANPGFDEGIGGIIALDRTAISARYKIVPFHDTVTITHDGGREYEEIVVAPQGLRSVSRYISAIILPKSRIFNTLEHIDMLVKDNFFPSVKEGQRMMRLLLDHPKRVERI